MKVMSMNVQFWVIFKIKMAFDLLEEIFIIFLFYVFLDDETKKAFQFHDHD